MVPRVDGDCPRCLWGTVPAAMVPAVMRLVRASTVEGDFVAVNVTGRGEVDALVRKTPTGHRLVMQRGMALLVR